jgi:hypothetical protein
VEKNTEQKKKNDEETVSDQEIWSTIRYLDRDTKTKASNIAVAITSLAIFSIVCIVCVLLLLRGL